RELYGFGRLYKVLFAIIAFVLAIPSVPVLTAGPESLSPYALSILFLIVVAVWILWVSVAAGSQAGILAGVAAMISRFAAFGVVAATLAGAETSQVGLARALEFRPRRGPRLLRGARNPSQDHEHHGRGHEQRQTDLARLGAGQGRRHDAERRGPRGPRRDAGEDSSP